METTFIRVVFCAVFIFSCYYFQPFDLTKPWAAAAGAVASAAIIVFEVRLRKTSLKQLIGAAMGSIMGISGAAMIGSMLVKTTMDPETMSFLQIGLFLFMGYVGLVMGANKGDLLNLSALGGFFSGERRSGKNYKILDTSVIIDGRVADVCETGFIDGILLIPQFVLRELQQVADSGDSLKRNRGRRGLDILQRVQKMAGIEVQILEKDFPQIREVDLKLIELAKDMDAKIVTNDFNLNKIAQLQDVPVLNINELANSLKPVVLPGEIMKVFILKEGKEYNQGVAYLDDGTMVVVDNARKMIGKTIDTSVTSVLQTTAGKMIFGRYHDRSHKMEAVGP